MFKVAMVILSWFSLSLFAHDGHDGTPGMLTANHGGKVEAGKDINLEYVVSGNEVKLFPASHEGKDLTAAEVQLVVSSKLPKGKAESVKLTSKDGAFVAVVDFKKAYRVEMSIEAIVNGKKSTFKIQIEK